jgi:ActR/RegA family two-component response regulator
MAGEAFKVAEAHERRHKRILFVDDEANIRATLPVILRKYGFEVRVASSVPEALHEIETHSFDLLLCDLNISTAGDGYNVVRAVRQANPRCATVILTGYPALETAVQSIHHGVDDYLIKPAGVEALIATLAERLAARQPKARILSVSCDETLLRTRHMLLERAGYEVVPAMGYEAGLGECNKALFDLFVLGHSIPNPRRRRWLRLSAECAKR